MRVNWGSKFNPLLLLFQLDNEIDGEAFLDLSEKDVKEIVKPLGQVKKIMRLQSTLNVAGKTVQDLDLGRNVGI